MQLAGTAAVVAGEAVIGQVVVTGPLGHVDVPGDAQLGVTVERARRDADRLAPGASQNKLEPHSPQNPRRAWASPAGLSTHRTARPSSTARSSRRAAVNAEMWPCHRRHSSQWQIRTSCSGPRTS